MRSVVQLGEVDGPELSLAVFGPVIGAERLARLEEAARTSRALLEGAVVWNVNSTASGGGVAEMLRILVGYIRGAGVDSRWLVIDADPRFFVITNRIHNRIHGQQGDQGTLGQLEAAHYREVSAANASALRRRLRPGNIVLLHDPQTAGLAPALSGAGVKVIWRSHVGSNTINLHTDEAWAFLRPHLGTCEAFVFSRRVLRARMDHHRASFHHTALH